MAERMSIEAEAARIETVALNHPAEALRALGALLDRPKRLTGVERAAALDFNARLVSELRRRDVKIWGTHL